MAENDRADGLLSGGRHYKGKGLGDLVAWNCPRCAQENTGPLDKGCVHCGSGSQQARHVGVPPPPSPHQKTIASDLSAEGPTPHEHAFVRWLSLQRIHPDDDRVGTLYLAWTSAIAWYQTFQEGKDQRPAETEPGNMVAIPRTVIQKVIEQLENTIDLPETESQSPELIALISELREALE